MYVLERRREAKQAGGDGAVLLQKRNGCAGRKNPRRAAAAHAARRLDTHPKVAQQLLELSDRVGQRQAMAFERRRGSHKDEPRWSAGTVLDDVSSSPPSAGSHTDTSMAVVWWRRYTVDTVGGGMGDVGTSVPAVKEGGSEKVDGKASGEGPPSSLDVCTIVVGHAPPDGMRAV